MIDAIMIAFGFSIDICQRSCWRYEREISMFVVPKQMIQAAAGKVQQQLRSTIRHNKIVTESCTRRAISAAQAWKPVTRTCTISQFISYRMYVYNTENTVFTWSYEQTERRGELWFLDLEQPQEPAFPGNSVVVSAIQELPAVQLLAAAPALANPNQGAGRQKKRWTGVYDSQRRFLQMLILDLLLQSRLAVQESDWLMMGVC